MRSYMKKTHLPKGNVKHQEALMPPPSFRRRERARVTASHQPAGVPCSPVIENRVNPMSQTVPQMDKDKYLPIWVAVTMNSLYVHEWPICTPLLKLLRNRKLWIDFVMGQSEY